jgi:hypothetical protein
MCFSYFFSLYFYNLDIRFDADKLITRSPQKKKMGEKKKKIQSGSELLESQLGTGGVKRLC